MLYKSPSLDFTLEISLRFLCHLKKKFKSAFSGVQDNTKENKPWCLITLQEPWAAAG